jgi:hypothetical protein
MATIIDHASAKSLIQEYQDQNAAPGGSGIKTGAGDLLHGYFLDRDSLETILKNPNVQGVSLHLAKHPDQVGSTDNNYTLLYTGAQPNTAANPTTPYESTGAIFASNPPCPPTCTTITDPV